MKLARIVFVIAGVWGIVVVTPLYFLHDVTGQPYAAPTLYPHFFYGFLSVTMAWQIAFLVIGSNPVRFRPLMIPSIIEKAGYVNHGSVSEDRRAGREGVTLPARRVTPPLPVDEAIRPRRGFPLATQS